MNIVQINNTLPSELEAVEYLEKARWGKTVKCPYCNSTKKGKRNKDMRWHCKSCQKSYSVTTNTHLHNTRLPIRSWLYAFSIISDAKKGLSALQLKRNLNISYPTAHKMYMKIRELMVDPEVKLNGVVEMDETFVGGKPRKANDISSIPSAKREIYNTKIKEQTEKGRSFKRKKGNPAKPDLNTKRGRGSEKKIPVVGIVQRDGTVVAEVMEYLSSRNLKAMVKRNVKAKDSVILTDNYKGYSKLGEIIEHIKLDHTKSFSYRGLNTNSIESFWAIVKRGIIGQYHQVSAKYLPQYVAEFVFKYNNRHEDDMFETLVNNAVKTPDQ